MQLAARPTSHDELIIAGSFLTISDQGVPFGQDKLSVLSIQFRDARERHQLPPVSVHTLFEDRLPSLARGGGLPLSHVQDQHAARSQRPGERPQNGFAALVIEEVVENPATENGVLSTGRQPLDVADRKRH